MSDEPQERTSRAGAVFVLLAVGGSAIGVAAWQLHSNRNPSLDTSGFDMSSTPEARRPAPAAPAAAVETPAPVRVEAPPATSLGMAKIGDMSVSGGKMPAAPGTPKEESVKTFKEAIAQNQAAVTAFIIKMEHAHPSISKYGEEWGASAELSGLRDQYWKDRDPMKFAYGVAKSPDFAKLLKKYSADPGVRDLLMSGMKEMPGGLIGAAGGILNNDNVVKDLANTVVSSLGLPPSLMAMLHSSNPVAPDQNQVLSEVLNSEQAKRAFSNQGSANAPAPATLDRR